MEVTWTKRAFQSLLEIEAFTAKGNPEAAQSHTEKLLSETDKLRDFPNMGRIVPEFPTSGLKELVIGNYRIVYRKYHESIQILTVFESHRQLSEQETL